MKFDAYETDARTGLAAHAPPGFAEKGASLSRGPRETGR